MHRFSTIYRAHRAAFHAARVIVDCQRPPGRVLRAMARSGARALVATVAVVRRWRGREGASGESSLTAVGAGVCGTTLRPGPVVVGGRQDGDVRTEAGALLQTIVRHDPDVVWLALRDAQTAAAGTVQTGTLAHPLTQAGQELWRALCATTATPTP